MIARELGLVVKRWRTGVGLAVTLVLIAVMLPISGVSAQGDSDGGEAVSAEAMDADAGSRSLTGVISDSASGTPLSGAEVVLSVDHGDPLELEQALVTTTDGDGRYSFEGLSEAVAFFTVTTNHPGYAAVSLQWHSDTDGAWPTDDLDLAADELFSIDIRVTDQSGNPLAGVAVSVMSMSISANSVWKTETDAEGHVIAELQPGNDYTVHVSHPDYLDEVWDDVGTPDWEDFEGISTSECAGLENPEFGECITDILDAYLEFSQFVLDNATYVSGDAGESAAMVFELAREDGSDQGGLPEFPDPEPGADSFGDDNGSVFEADIEWMAASGITAGCSASSFCPDDPVTRGQMAAFLFRALNGYVDEPNPTVDFTDDNGSIFESQIEWMSRTGITTGCTATEYCPDGLVTRGQMAAFLHRALGDLIAADGDPVSFVDMAGSVFGSDVEWMSRTGITAGCSATEYCPDGLVTRGQMAAFLHRALS